MLRFDPISSLEIIEVFLNTFALDYSSVDSHLKFTQFSTHCVENLKG